MQIITLTRVNNPLDRSDQDRIEYEFVSDDNMLDDLIAHSLPDCQDGLLDVVVSINGKQVVKELWGLTKVFAGQEITIVPVIHGGNGQDKSPLKSLLMVVIIVVAAYVSGGAGGAAIFAQGGALAGYAGVAGAAIMLGGSLLINAMFPVSTPSLELGAAGSAMLANGGSGAGGGGTSQKSNAFSWNPQTAQQQGITLPWCYGTCRITGNIISAYRHTDRDKQVMNMLISLGEGPLGRIYDHKINGQSITISYTGVTITPRLGRLYQLAVPGFEETKTEYPLTLKAVKASPVTYRTMGNSFEGLEVEVGFLSGLYKYNKDGSIAKASVSYKIEIKKVGDTNWQILTEQVAQTANGGETASIVTGAVQTTHYTGKWQLGRMLTNHYTGAPVWYPIYDGSTNILDHIDGERNTTLRAASVKNTDQEIEDGGEFYSYYPETAVTPCGLGPLGCVNGRPVEKIEVPNESYWHWKDSAAPYVTTANITQNYTTATRDQIAPLYFTFRYQNLLPGQYDVLVTRITADSLLVTTRDELYLTAVREIVSDGFRYPGEALVGIQALATDQISGSLTYECKTDGKLCQVYRSGTWYVEATSNPAWVAFDILTQPIFNDDNTVNSYRAHNPSKLDMTRWLEWAAYCDDYAPNGKGNWEHRLTWNGMFDASSSMWDAVISVCAIGRAVPYWRGNIITVAIDKAASPVALISVGNIGLDSFEEIFLSQDSRAGAVECDFLNIENELQRDKLTIYNTSAPADWGSATASMVGEVRPSGIYRHAIFQLARTQAITRLVSVVMATDSISFTLGDVVNVQHDTPMWGEGGRIVSATCTGVPLDNLDPTTVTLDKPVVIVAGKTYKIMVRLLDGTITNERTVTNTPGTYTTLTVSTAFLDADSDPVVPNAYDVWAFGEASIYIKPMRVIGIYPQGDMNRKIMMEDYNASLYTLDAGLPLIPTLNYTPKPTPENVTNLRLSERLVMVAGQIKTILTATWDRLSANTRTQSMNIWASVDNSIPIKKGEVDNSSISFEMTVNDGEQWRVYVQSSNGIINTQLSISPNVIRTIIGKTAPPDNVTNFHCSATSFVGVIFTWNAVADLDIHHYEIRYSSLMSGATWENSQFLSTSAGTSLALPAALDGSYFIKAVDTGGRVSVTATELITTIPSLVQFNFIEEVNDGTSWTGTKENCYTANGKLYLDMAGLWDDITDFDAWTSMDSYGGAKADGYFYPSETVDLGTVQTARCGMACEWYGVNSQSLWDDILDFDAVVSFNDVSGVGIEAQIALSNDGSTWTDWSAFVAGDYTARYFKFRVYLYSSIPTNYPYVNQFLVSIDMADRAMRGQGVSIASGGSTITFTQPYKVAPIVRATINDAASGDTVKITSVTATSFTIQILNGGSGVARSIDWQTVSY